LVKKAFCNSIYGVLALILIGCAGASSEQLAQARPAINQRPSTIVVYHLAVDSADVTLNQSIVQTTYRNISDTDESAKQRQLALDAAADICLGVATQLKEKGYNAICQDRGTKTYGNNALIIDGAFSNISEGNRLRRMVIGLGSGQSAIDTTVNVFQLTDSGVQQVMQFTTHADSGSMPGAAIMGAPGMAAGGSAAAVSLGVNVASSGVKAHRSSLGYLADKTAEETVNSITQYYAQQGWS
jgi:Domain of unknown function (DUF4410)